MDDARDTIPKEADDPSMTRNIYNDQPGTTVTTSPPAVDKYPDYVKITTFSIQVKAANIREKLLNKF